MDKFTKKENTQLSPSSPVSGDILARFLRELGKGNLTACHDFYHTLRQHHLDSPHSEFESNLDIALKQYLVCRQLDIWFCRHIKNFDLQSSTLPSQKSVGNKLHSIRNIAAITYHGRSGSYLLCSAFDGHPDILSVDYTLNTLFRFFSKTGPDHNLLHEKSSPAIEKILKEIHASLTIDRFKKFATVFLQMLCVAFARTGKKTNKGDLFRIIFLAWHEAHDYELPKNPIIVYSKHTSSDIDFKNMCQYFDTVFLLQCTRQPGQTIASHIRHHVVETPALPFSTIVSRMILPYEDCLRRCEVANNLVHQVVRFEDMHNDIEQLSKAMCSLLKIPFSAEMTTSTLNRKSYLHERSDAQKGDEKTFSGFGHKNVHKKQPEWMSEIDIFRLTCLFSDATIAYDYPTQWLVQFKLFRLVFFLLLLPLPMRAEITAYRYAQSKKSTRENFRKFVKVGYGLRIELTKRLFLRLKTSPPLPIVCKR